MSNRATAMFANGAGNNNDKGVNAFVSQSGYLIATRNERPVLLTHYLGVKKNLSSRRICYFNRNACHLVDGSPDPHEVIQPQPNSITIVKTLRRSHGPKPTPGKLHLMHGASACLLPGSSTTYVSPPKHRKRSHSRGPWLLAAF